MQKQMNTLPKKHYSAQVFEQDSCLVETSIQTTCVLSPYLAGMSEGAGGIRVTSNRLGYCLKLIGQEFEGWGLFQAYTANQAVLNREATQSEIDSYLSTLPSWEMRLIAKIHGKTWLAQARQQLPGVDGDTDWYDPSDAPVLVHLVEDGREFELCQAGFDGHNLWFHRKITNPEAACPDQMAQALARKIQPNKLRIAGLSQMDRMAYSVGYLETLGQRAGAPDASKGQAGGLPGLLGTGILRKVEWLDLRGQKAEVEFLRRDLRVRPNGLVVNQE